MPSPTCALTYRGLAGGPRYASAACVQRPRTAAIRPGCGGPAPASDPGPARGHRRRALAGPRSAVVARARGAARPQDRQGPARPHAADTQAPPALPGCSCDDEAWPGPWPPSVRFTDRSYPPQSSLADGLGRSLCWRGRRAPTGGSGRGYNRAGNGKEACGSHVGEAQEGRSTRPSTTSGARAPTSSTAKRGGSPTRFWCPLTTSRPWKQSRM